MKALADRGFVVLREGARHTPAGRPGQHGEPVPRHNEINRVTLRRIVRNLSLDWDAFEADVR